MGNLSQLFHQKQSVSVDSTVANPTSIDVNVVNPDARKDKETYGQWGSRMCGKVSASPVALPAYLNKVFLDIKKAQSENEQLQNDLKQGIQNDIEQNRNKQKNVSDQIDDCNRKIRAFNDMIEDWKMQKQKIEQGKEEVNKDEKMKMIVGLVILIPLTIYLFVFYSSAFYSAFFKDFSYVTGLASAMFDANAIPHAFKDGVMEAMFILFAPIIFMGLGFILHFFSKQVGWTKYLKVSAILLVTLTFDVIIAYQIGKHIYDNWVLSQLGDFPDFSVSKAIVDPNFWAVIFCGFIAYIIWGLVFNLIMAAYSNLDLSQSKLKNLDEEIKGHVKNSVFEK